MLKYLEIDSTYRDRKAFPNPAVFDVLNFQNGVDGKAKDPVSLGTPIVTYIPNDIDNLVSTSIQTSETSIATSVIVCFPTAQNPNHDSDYYRGLQVQLNTATIDLGRITIQSWDFLNTVGTDDCFRVTFTPAIDSFQITGIQNFEIIPSTNFALGHVFIPKGTFSSQVYRNFFIYNETNGEFKPILVYDGANSLASIEPPIGWNTTDTISLREELPFTTDTFQAGSTTIKTILSSSTSRDVTDFFLRIIQSTGPGAVNQNKICKIISYNQTTFEATLDCVLPYAPDTGDSYEILSFTRDTFNPLNYCGTHVSQEVCYEVQLVHLIVPNLGLIDGGVLPSHPYLYIDFQNYTTSGGGTTNVIYSNNPNAIKRLFRLPVTDVSPSSINSFLTLDKCYMAQNIRITPYSSFRFGVYLPDGTPLQFSVPDNDSPSPPNANVQVSALFSLRRLSQ